VRIRFALVLRKQEEEKEACTRGQPENYLQMTEKRSGGWLAMGLDEMSPLTSDDDAAITLGCITLTVIYC
jgi:hypothetical protein